jgi:HK97 gp10 family phage protein
VTSVKLEVVGLTEVVRALETYGQRASKEIADAIALTALDVEADAKKSIQRGTKSGRTYTYDSTTSDKYTTIKDGDDIVAVFKNTGRNGSHTASAPGEAPASDTGRLAGSITAEKKGPLLWDVGTDVKYGRFLEFGTMKIAERPWLRPAIEKNRALFRKRIVVAIEKASQ